MDDERLVARQLGRPPRGRWRVAARCSFGHPSVVLTAPSLDDGSPFPTLFYLTCPHLVRLVADLESAGGIETWRSALGGDPVLARRLSAADAAYRAARAAEAGGTDPVPGAGIAGQRDPAATKCLHAHVAAYLAGLDDPIGEGVIGSLVRECGDNRCGGDT
jgi:hypothetical protein